MPVEPRTSHLVARLDRLVAARLAKTLKPFDLSVSQYTLMSVVESRPGLSNAQLARHSYITAQAMHQLVNTLTDRGLIERSSSPGHRRIQMTVLTPEGRDLLDECDEAVTRVEDELFGHLDPGEESHLRHIVDSIIHHDDRTG